MGARMRAFDWARTSLGAPERWPSSLKAILRAMLTSRFAMWMAWGPEKLFFCNDAYLPTTGVKADWALGARSDQLWSEIWADIGPRIERVLTTGEATWDEALLLYLERREFQEETYHTFSYSPLADDDGRTAGMLCVVAEVTERVIGERQLATLRDLGSRLAAAPTRAEVVGALRASLAAEPADLPFALAYFFEPGHARAVLAAVHGLAADTPGAVSVLDARADDAVWPVGAVLAGRSTVVETAPALLGTFPLGRWQRAPLQALVVPVGGAEGAAPVGMLVAGLNPHRALDGGYRGFIELLAGQLAAAVARADAFERELARSSLLAELDRAKTMFFSNISHEFRTPLTLMLGPLEDALAEREGLPAAQAARIELAQRNGLRLLRLVNGLLDFSRIEAGRVEANFRPVELGVLTAELASTFRSACERAGLTLALRCAGLGEPVYVDPEMWEKIVLNLLSNAFKFTLAGGITVALERRAGMAELTVADTGTGIPAAALPKLFERFHRVEGARGRSFEGSGIGLALVDELVRQHGGSIGVESEEGRGSTFRVRVPLGAAHLPAERVRAAEGPVGAGGRARAFAEEALRWLPAQADAGVIRDVERGGLGIQRPGGPRRGGRVLLADDNGDLRDYVCRLLEDRGYDVEAVGDGAAALAAARAERPDLLLSDVMMPGLDGFGLLAAMRADPALSDVPVILLSARAGEEAQVDGLQAGADDYLSKPFSARELLARVAANLDIARTRREASAAVRESEARLRGVLEGMAEGFSLLDRDFRIVELNAEALRMEQRPASALIGRTHWEAYPGSEHSELGRLYKRAVAERRPVSLEHLYRWEDGRERWLEMRAYPTEDGGLAIFYRDVTDRRVAQDSLRDMNESLERRVAAASAEREAALVRLNETQRLETLGQLTGGVAHDFNNLLTPIMAALDLLRRRHPDDRSQRLISGGLQSAERAKTLVGRLLSFARRRDLEPRAIEPATLIGGVRELIEQSLGPGIRVVVDVPAELPAVLVDPNQMELALLNLAVNARDAMPQGGDLTIAARDEDCAGKRVKGLKAGRYVRFEVTDTGCGMDAATLARAMEPFFSTKEVGHGTGLGLSMAHGLAVQSGGLLELASAVGAGTTATMWLPVTERAMIDAVARPAEIAAAATRATLLLVDDEELVRTGTAALLEELGYEVVQAGSAAAALERVRAGLSPALVITDHMMPGMTGAQLAAALRDSVPGVPVLMVTGYADLDGTDLGELAVLAKPFTFVELAGRVAAVLARTRESCLM
jgi:PAS domain S-box-containing protein